MDTFHLTLEIECVDLPVELPEDCSRLGLQLKREVVQDAACTPGQPMHFQAELELELDLAQDHLRFRGGFVQGPRQEPFIYLCWGDRAGAAWQPSRRAKFHLSAFPVEMLRQAAVQQRPLHARIRMTDARGRPAAATLKPDRYQVSLAA